MKCAQLPRLTLRTSPHCVVGREGPLQSASKQEFSVAWAAWAADCLDPKNILMLGATGSGMLNNGSYSNPKFDALIARSDRTPVSPAVKGWVDNEVNIHRSRWLFLDRRALV